MSPTNKDRNSLHTSGRRRRMRTRKGSTTNVSSTSRRSSFMRFMLMCCLVVGGLIVRYPSIIQDSINGDGDVVLKLDNILTHPLHPEHEHIMGLDHYFMIPSQNATSSGAPEGILIYFHSCGQTGLDFFTLPEHRIIAKRAIDRGLAIFSPTSRNRKSGCFTFEDTNGHLKNALDRFVATHHLLGVPRMGLGGSSGGAFVPFVQRALRLESLAVYNSPQRPIDEEDHFGVPTAFVTMSRDLSISERMTANMLTLREMNVSTALYKISPRPFTPELCGARFPELSIDFCLHIFQTIKKDHSSLLDSDGYVIQEDTNSTEWRNCFAKLESDYNTKFAKTSPRYEPYPVRYQTKHSNSKPTKSWWQVIVEEEIRTSYGFHAMTAQFHDEILQFLTSNSKTNKQ